MVFPGTQNLFLYNPYLRIFAYIMKKKKIAIALFNLGGPDSLSAVKPFLFNLFYDKHIINLPNPFRYLLAKFISSTREKTAIKIYKYLGGKSPIVEFSLQQASELEKKLLSVGDENSEYKTFVVMRYWHPRAINVVKNIADFSPDEVILLPLYPQYSTTTSLSSILEFQRFADESKITNNRRSICCYYYNDDFVKSHVNAITSHIQQKKTPYKYAAFIFSSWPSCRYNNYRRPLSVSGRKKPLSL